MSTQTNQFLMWAIRLPFSFSKDWTAENHKRGGEQEFYEHFEKFICDDSAYEDDIKHEDGIFLLMDGRDGRFIFIGRVLAKAKDEDLLGDDKPVEVKQLTESEKEFIKESVNRNFSVAGEFKYWIATVYR